MRTSVELEIAICACAAPTAAIRKSRYANQRVTTGGRGVMGTRIKFNLQ